MGQQNGGSSGHCGGAGPENGVLRPEMAAGSLFHRESGDSRYHHQRHAMQRQRTGTLETLKSEFLTILRRQEPLLLIV